MKYFFFFFLFITIVFSFFSDFGIKTYYFEGMDKIKHIVAFFTISFFFYKSFYNIRDIHKFFILVTFAGIIELVQSFVGREASFLDFIASCLGVILYLLLSSTFFANLAIWEPILAVLKIFNSAFISKLYFFNLPFYYFYGNFRPIFLGNAFMYYCEWASEVGIIYVRLYKHTRQLLRMAIWQPERSISSIITSSTTPSLFFTYLPSSLSGS